MGQRRKFFLLLLLFGFMALFILLLFTSRHSLRPLVTWYVPSTNFITVFQNRKFRNSTWKTILLWTDFFGSKDWWFQERLLTGCAKSKCRVTHNRGRLGESDAVLFNTRSLHRNTVLPEYRNSEQVWVLHDSEPPYYIFLDWNQYAGVFNWTSWYRLDADVFSPYGNFTKLPKGTKPLWLNFFASKTNFSYWAASSCTDRNRRYRLMHQLEQFLDIDTYGACGRLTCRKGSPVCNTIFKDYKFSFALENGQCRDYVTEKFWGALQRDQIPIAWGGADYKRLAPPNSFIDIRDFETLEGLATYIRRVGDDEELYNSYFTWRKDYVLTEDRVVDWCSLCKALHDPRKPAQSYTDLKGWASEDSCNLYSTWRQLTDYLSRFFFLIGL